MWLLDIIDDIKNRRYEKRLEKIVIEDAYIYEYVDVINKIDNFNRKKQIEKRRQTDYDEDVRYRISSSKSRSEIVRELKVKKETGVLSYDDFTFETSISFSQLLLKYLEEKNMSEPDLYNACGITRQTYYKIKNIEGYIPRKTTIFNIILTLKLDIDEANELLKLAGYQFNPTSKVDSYIKYCIVNGLYDIFEINEYLYKHTNTTI